MLWGSNDFASIRPVLGALGTPNGAFPISSQIEFNGSGCDSCEWRKSREKAGTFSVSGTANLTLNSDRSQTQLGPNLRRRTAYIL